MRELDRLVREHRFTIAVVFPAVGAVLLVASAEAVLPPPLRFNPYLVLLGTAVMRLPLVAAVLPLLDRRAGALLAGVTAYVYAIEFVGLATGWPYGEFRYLVELGPTVAGVPAALPLFFVPLALDGYLLAVLLVGSSRRALRLAAAVGVVLAVDLALDPAAVAVGFWTYPDGGSYYGVPASNYAGWLLSAAVAVLAFDLAFDRAVLGARLRECEFALDDLVSFTLLWGAINLLYANWIPVAVTAALIGGLAWTGRFDVAAPAGPLRRLLGRFRRAG